MNYKTSNCSSIRCVAIRYYFENFLKFGRRYSTYFVTIFPDNNTCFVKVTLVFLKLIKPEAEAKAELVQAVQAVQVAQAVPVVLVVPVDASEVNGSK